MFFIPFLSQAQALDNGESQVNVGVGLSGWGIPVYLGYEYGITSTISAGIEGSYRNFSQKYSGSKYKYSAIGVGVYGNYHFNKILNIPDPWDVYAGATLGYYNLKVDNDYPGAFDSGISFGGQIGTRYYISDRFGVNLEFNGGSVVTGGKLGVTIKL